MKIPNLSQSFDPEWETNGLLMQAAEFIKNWVVAQEIPGLTSELIKEPTRTPLLIFTIPGSTPESDKRQILMYGHLDKQPHGTGWTPGFGPTDAKEKDGKLCPSYLP